VRIRHRSAGADPNLLAGNGMTAVEIADARVATGVAAILERPGGVRASRTARRQGRP
jgi:hypothetical protein